MIQPAWHIGQIMVAPQDSSTKKNLGPGKSSRSRDILLLQWLPQSEEAYPFKMISLVVGVIPRLPTYQDKEGQMLVHMIQGQTDGVIALAVVGNSNEAMPQW